MSDDQIKIDEVWDKRVNQLFEECANKSFKENVSYSQILFRFDQEEKSLLKAEEIINNLGIDILDIKTFNFPKDSIFFALFKLNITDIREVVLALAQEDYVPIKGYSAFLQDL